ncbi:two-component system, response regulator YesN [Paenibacillus sp. UNCCL117]|uniref:response regulator transcription factor n=1 Tax=unclassified Paenibacillus TaxID=185978 RepID=UPI000882B0B0|nr:MULTISPECIES: helix-turn-helix domain-containing protein [unclassified Paenibacillus]SDC28054.1 two-component system, response regulator YesN [Paenibacillus sp. cl123]SFW20468.1 two-component system, response regulator YesN [Paenibacillus sp. UNCCL117]
MHKVMLIDDDVPMLNYLHQLVEWDRLGLQVAGDTYSSVKALRLFQELMPDIVVTDIGLPQMNGLELAAEFIRIKPGVRLIFLTCHEDFQYAKQALKLDADDYLIKDELTAEQLEQSLTKSIKLLQTSSVNLEQLSYREDLNRNIDLHKQALFKQLIKGDDGEALLGYAGRLGIHWDHPSFRIGIGYMTCSSFVSSYSYKDISLIRFGVYNIASELAQDFEGFTLFNEPDFLVMVLNYRHTLKLNAQQAMQSFMSELREKSRQYLKVELGFLYDPDKLELSGVGTAYRQLIRAQYSDYYTQPSTALSRPALVRSYLPLAGLPGSLTRELHDAVKQGDPALVEAGLASLHEFAQAAQAEPGELIQSCGDILRFIELSDKKPGASEDFYGLLQSTLHLDDTLGLMRWKLLQILKNRPASEEAHTKETKLQQIEQYISQHLAENLTYLDMANYLFLNPSYFSRYFKRLTGENFTDYVHRYKIKIASKMLESSNDSIEMVALKLGYSDRTYFSKVFKKYIGMTPGEYKSKNG